MQGDAGPQLRAWVEYFRDLGVHDFYRHGEVAPALATEAGSDLSIQSAVMVDAAPNRGGVIAAAAEGAASFAEYAAPALHLAADSPAPQLMKLISFNHLAPLPAERIPPAERAAALRAIQDEIGDCTRCPLAYAGRHKIVFGDGSPTARLMFVGEGPGADEDAQGLPFVGKAGLTSDRIAFPEVTVALNEFLMPPTLALVRGVKPTMRWRPGGPWRDS